MKVTVWGTRGSQASPGPDTVRYGGNTSCVEVEAEPLQPVVEPARAHEDGVFRHIGALFWMLA